jgi:hypothetical protein
MVRCRSSHFSNSTHQKTTELKIRLRAKSFAGKAVVLKNEFGKRDWATSVFLFGPPGLAI